MPRALRVDGLAVGGGIVRIKITEGSTPLPAEAEGQGVIFDAALVDDYVAEAEDALRRYALAMIARRAHAIDPSHGATFRNNINGTVITLDWDSDNVVVITR